MLAYANVEYPQADFTGRLYTRVDPVQGCLHLFVFPLVHSSLQPTLSRHPVEHITGALRYCDVCIMRRKSMPPAAKCMTHMRFGGLCAALVKRAVALTLNLMAHAFDVIQWSPCDSCTRA